LLLLVVMVLVVVVVVVVVVVMMVVLRVPAQGPRVAVRLAASVRLALERLFVPVRQHVPVPVDTRTRIINVVQTQLLAIYDPVVHGSEHQVGISSIP